MHAKYVISYLLFKQWYLNTSLNVAGSIVFSFFFIKYFLYNIDFFKCSFVHFCNSEFRRDTAYDFVSVFITEVFQDFARLFRMIWAYLIVRSRCSSEVQK